LARNQKIAQIKEVDKHLVAITKKEGDYNNMQGINKRLQYNKNLNVERK
jgi:hypothetical protein